MKYLIPSWYHPQIFYRDKAVPFYEKHHITEYDDLVSLANMFQKHDEQISLIILNYSSALRHFLYRNGLYEANYWSVFDEIQGFKNTTPQSIDYRDLSWPEGTEFIYTPYIVRAYTSDNTYSDIYVSQEGYLMWIEDYQDNKIDKRYVFDDRGFLSTIIEMDEKHQAETVTYLNIQGQTVMTEDAKSGEVAVAETESHRFKHLFYASMEDVISEFLGKYTQQHIKDNDKVIVASDIRHNTLITELIERDNLCFSIFSQRQSVLDETLFDTIKHANYWLTDNEKFETVLREITASSDHTTQIMRHTPFPTEILPNLSSQLPETKIGWMIDGLSESDIHRYLDVLIPYIDQTEDRRLVLLTRYSNSQTLESLKERIEQVNDQYVKAQPGYELLSDEELEALKRIELTFIPFEADLIKQIATLRIVIDVNEEPDLFLQISCISACIPQINQTPTDYMIDGANGELIKDINDLPKALNHYLLELKRWNFAYAYSVQLVETYASKNLVHQLNQFLEGDLNDETL